MDEEHDQQLMRESKLKSGTSGSKTRASSSLLCDVLVVRLKYQHPELSGFESVALRRIFKVPARRR